MSNLTFDHGLLKEHPPEPLEGHAVVVFRRVGKAGEEFHSILLPGAVAKRRPFRKPAGYFACAVDAFRVHELNFSERVSLADHPLEFDVGFDLAYAVSDARMLAQARNADPLRRVRDKVRETIRREVEQLPWQAVWEAFPSLARAVVDECMEELRAFAGGYGIAIQSLRLAGYLPEASEQACREELFGLGQHSTLNQTIVNGKLSLRNAQAARELVRARMALIDGVAAAAECDDPSALHELAGQLRALSPGLGGGLGAGCAALAAPRAPERRPVLLGGSAPRQAQPGDVILAQLAAYVAAFESRARQLLEREAQLDEVRLGEETDCQWAFGARVSVRCRAQGLIVPTPVQSFVWNGECRAVSFDLEVPADAQPRRTVIVMEAFVHDGADAVQVARLAMALEIVAEAPAPAPPQTVRAAAARTAFASYAAQDRTEVLERISSIRRSAGLEVFVDVVGLRTGEQWEPALRAHILACDRFLLFWSEHARDSHWVAWEWQQALDAKGDEVLELHLLRHVPAEDVPERLRKFHFDDVYLRARDAEFFRREHALPAVA